MLHTEMLLAHTPERSHARSAAVVGAAVAAALILAGCESQPGGPVARTEHVWDGYLPTLTVSANPGAASENHPEFSRRDVALAMRGDVIDTPMMYLTEDRPSLSYPRRYYFPTSAEGYTYFRTESEVRSDVRWRWGY